MLWSRGHASNVDELEWDDEAYTYDITDMGAILENDKGKEFMSHFHLELQSTWTKRNFDSDFSSLWRHNPNT